LQQGNFLTVTGEGFKPNSVAVAWLFSQPRRLGVITVGADGAYAANLRIAEEVPPGQHTAQVNGLTIDGQVRSLNLAVEVVDEIVTPGITESPGTTPRDSKIWVYWLLSLVLVAILFSRFGFVVGRRSDETKD